MKGIRMTDSFRARKGKIHPPFYFHTPRLMEVQDVPA